MILKVVIEHIKSCNNKRQQQQQQQIIKLYAIVIDDN